MIKSGYALRTTSGRIPITPAVLFEVVVNLLNQPASLFNPEWKRWSAKRRKAMLVLLLSPIETDAP